MSTSTESHAGFFSHLHKRIIVLSTMERDVRIMFAAGAAVVPLGVGLVFFHNYLGPPITTMVGTLPVGALIALFLCELLALFLLCSGLMRLKGRRRQIALGIALLIFSLHLAMNDFQAEVFVLIIPIFLLFGLAESGERQKWDGRRLLLSAATVTVMTMAILVVYEVAAQQPLIISTLALQGLLAMLGLFMAATDIAEVISVAVESGVAATAGRFGAAWPALIVAIFAVVANFLVSFLDAERTAVQFARHLGAGIGLVPWLALLLWPLVSAKKRLGSIAPELHYRNLLFVVGAYFVALQTGIGWRVLSDPATYDPAAVIGDPLVAIPPIGLFLVFLILFPSLGRRSQHVFATLGYGICVGMFWFHLYSSKGRTFIHIQEAVAVGSFIFLAITCCVKSMRLQLKAFCILLAQLNLCFAVYALIVRFFLPSHEDHGEHTGPSVWHALILFAALAWDVLASGGAITNKHSETFPRISRVCLFLAYIVSVTLLVVVSTSGKFVSPATSKPIRAVFEPEPLVAAGLLIFGGPFFFLMFALGVRQIRRQAHLAVSPISTNLNMAIHQCAECGGKVSDKASSCPHCGAPIETALAELKRAAPEPLAPKKVGGLEAGTMACEPASSSVGLGGDVPPGEATPAVRISKNEGVPPSPFHGAVKRVRTFIQNLGAARPSDAVVEARQKLLTNLEHLHGAAVASDPAVREAAHKKFDSTLFGDYQKKFGDDAFSNQYNSATSELHAWREDMAIWSRFYYWLPIFIPSCLLGCWLLLFHFDLFHWLQRIWVDDIGATVKGFLSPPQIDLPVTVPPAPEYWLVRLLRPVLTFVPHIATVIAVLMVGSLGVMGANIPFRALAGDWRVPNCDAALARTRSTLDAPPARPKDSKIS